MKIVICEDEPRWQSAMTEAIGRWMDATGHKDVETAVFSSSEDLLGRLGRDADVDLLFMDIEIPGEMNGVELARRIREAHLHMTIVFCTNFSEYVYEGYTVNALRYLKKPVQQADIDFCLSYVYNRLALSSDQALSLACGGKRYALRHLEILCIEARIHSLHIFTTRGKEPLRIPMRLADIKKQLPAALFVACHRSYIVNIAHVRMLTRSECILSSGTAVPVSRTCAESMNRAFDRYHQGGGTGHALDGI